MKLYSKRFLHLTIHKGAVLGHVGIPGSWVSRFGPKAGQIGPKWDQMICPNWGQSDSLWAPICSL